MMSYIPVPVKHRVQGAGVESGEFRGELRGELFGRAVESGEAVSRFLVPVRDQAPALWKPAVGLCASGARVVEERLPAGLLSRRGVVGRLRAPCTLQPVAKHGGLAVAVKHHEV